MVSVTKLNCESRNLVQSCSGVDQCCRDLQKDKVVDNIPGPLLTYRSDVPFADRQRLKGHWTTAQSPLWTDEIDIDQYRLCHLTLPCARGAAMCCQHSSEPRKASLKQ